MLNPRNIAFVSVGLALALPAAANKQATLIKQLDREVIALKERNQLLTTRLETCDQSGGSAAIYTELVQIFSSTEVSVTRQGTLTHVSIPSAVLFTSSGLQIRQEATMILDMLAMALNLHPTQEVWIIGHTGDLLPSGSLRHRFRSNWELSTFQASALLHMLTDRFALDAHRFTVAGKGSTEPIANNDTPAGRSDNNRLVIVIHPPPVAP